MSIIGSWPAKQKKAGPNCALCTSLLSRQVRRKAGLPDNARSGSHDRDVSEPNTESTRSGEAVSYAVGLDDAAADGARAGPLRHCDTSVGVSGCFGASLVARSDPKTLGDSPRNVFAAARVGRHSGVGARCGEFDPELEGAPQSHPTDRVDVGFGHRPWVGRTGHRYSAVTFSQYPLGGGQSAVGTCSAVYGLAGMDGDDCGRDLLLPAAGIGDGTVLLRGSAFVAQRYGNQRPAHALLVHDLDDLCGGDHSTIGSGLWADDGHLGGVRGRFELRGVSGYF